MLPTQIIEKKMSSTPTTPTSLHNSSTRLISSDVSEIVAILEGGKTQKISNENEMAPPVSIISLPSSSTTTTAAVTTPKDNTKKLLTITPEPVPDLSTTTVQSNLSLSNKRNMIRYNKSSAESETTKTNDEDDTNNKKKMKALLGDISTSSKEQFKGSSSTKHKKKHHKLHSHSKNKISPINKSPSKSADKSSIISPTTKTKSPLLKRGRPKTKVVVNGDVLTSISSGVQHQVELQVSDQIVNVQEVLSPTKEEKVLANVIRSGLKRNCRGRSSLRPNSKKSHLDIDFPPQALGLIPTITINEEDNDANNLEVPHHSRQHSNVVGVGVGEKEAFNPCQEEVYENALYGHSKISCLPREPKKLQDRAKSNLDMINLLLGERQREQDQFKLWSRAHLDVQRSIFNQFNYTMTSDDISRFDYLTKYANGPTLKLRDLNDVDSYEILARRIDEDGIARYLIQWKDGNGNEYDDEQDNKVDELMEVDEQEPEVVKAVETTEAEKIHILAGSTNLEESLRSVVPNPNGILSTCGENAAVSVQVPSTSTSNSSKDTTTTKINLSNIKQEVNSVSSSSLNGALPPTTTTTTSTAAEVLSEIPKQAIINDHKTPTNDIVPIPAIAIKIEKMDDGDKIVIGPKGKVGRKSVPYVDLTAD